MGLWGNNEYLNLFKSKNKMEVVNVKVKYIRPKYKNLKEWCEDKKNVYIGRKAIVFIDGERYPKKDSPFANPYKIGKDGTREEIIKKYEIYIKDKILKGELDLEQLRGKTLGCWCKPETCHGEILLKLLDSLSCSTE